MKLPKTSTTIVGILLSLAVSVCTASPFVVPEGFWLVEKKPLEKVTNGPALFAPFRLWMQRTNTLEFPRRPITNASGEIIQRPPARIVQTNDFIYTNNVFEGFRPDSLHHLLWTNFIAHTNNRDTLIWSERSHGAGWPNHPPTVSWNTNNLMWGMRGMTAISPCWAGEGGQGQVPVTALTRRHGYTRGHGMGVEGVNTNSIGMRVWFLATNDSLVEVRIQNSMVRARQTRNADYTVLLFDRNLPDSITPMRVASPTNVAARYPVTPDAPRPLFMTEQTGHVSADISGSSFFFNIMKGGDSGSPNMLPIPDELVFVSGRTTSGPDKAMQDDVDELSRLAGLNPRDHQLQWVDLEKFPVYPSR